MTVSFRVHLQLRLSNEKQQQQRNNNNKKANAQLLKFQRGENETLGQKGAMVDATQSSGDLDLSKNPCVIVWQLCDQQNAIEVYQMLDVCAGSSLT